MIIPQTPNLNNKSEGTDAIAYVAVRNGEASAALSAGDAVVWDFTTAADGISVIKPTTAMLSAQAGIVDSRTIAAGDTGLVQCYGYRDDASIKKATVAAGAPLILANGETRLTGDTVLTGSGYLAPPFIAGQAVTGMTGTATGQKVFIRCM